MKMRIYTTSVIGLVLFHWLKLILTTPLYFCLGNIPVSSLIATVDGADHFQINVLKKLCVLLSNVTTKHLFLQLSTFCGVLLHNVVFICVQLFRTVLANHVLTMCIFDQNMW